MARKRAMKWNDLHLRPRGESITEDKVSYPFVLLGCDLGTEINPILYTKKEWESYNFTPFYENVNRDGISLI